MEPIQMLLCIPERDFGPVDIPLELIYYIFNGICLIPKDRQKKVQCVECVSVFAVVVVGVEKGTEPIMLLKCPFYYTAFMDGVRTILGGDIENDVADMYVLVVDQ